MYFSADLCCGAVGLIVADAVEKGLVILGEQ